MSGRALRASQPLLRCCASEPIAQQLCIFSRQIPQTSGQRLTRRQIRSASSASTSSQPKPPGFLRRNRIPVIVCTIGASIGAICGFLVVHTLTPPPLPEPGTHEDQVLMADLEARLDAEFKIKVLRGKCLGVAKQLKGEAGEGWFELIELPAPLGGGGGGNEAADTSGAEAGKKDDMSTTADSMTKSLSGARGFGAERLFWSRGKGSLISVIWVGGSISGWPGNTHGGALATLLTDKIALAALLSDSARSDTLAAATPQRLPGTGNHAKMLRPSATPDQPAGLSLTYLAPSHANQFFVVRVTPREEELRGVDLESQEDGGGAGAARARKVIPVESRGGPEFDASIETLNGTVCVKAQASFMPNPNGSSMSQHSGRGSSSASLVGSSYADFKEWMWPSRQQQSQLG